jgi:hypothetical protein
MKEYLMSDPIQTPEPEVGVQVAVATTPGPDGKPWVQLQINIGLAGFALLVPERGARALAQAIPQALTLGADNARREALGLLVAGNGHLPGILLAGGP